jgi:hypothetical protein
LRYQESANASMQASASLKVLVLFVQLQIIVLR